MAPPSLLLIPTLCFLLVPVAQSAHLLMAPLALHSHTAAFQAIAEELVRRGHQVTFMYNEASKHGTKLAASGFRVLTFECKGDICEKFDSLSTELAQVALEEPGDVIAFYRNIINNIAPGECDRMLGDDVFQQKIADSKFDFALMDGIFFYRCAYMVPYRHHIPYATVEDVVDARTAALPWLPSIVPFPLLGHTEKMTFWERLKNTLFFAIFALNDMKVVINTTINDQYQTMRPFKSHNELVSKSLLWITPQDPLMDYSKPSQSYVITAGGLTAKPGKPLPKNLENVVHEAKHGVILVTFGSTVEVVPKRIITRFMAAFSQLKQTIIWRLRKGAYDVPANVFLFDWLPQNDLLAHPNVLLFITHSGSNGQHEALYHGKPMIGMPIFGDQNYNAVRAAYKGYGLKMDINTFSSDQLVANVKEVLGNPIYALAIGKASKIVRSRTETSPEVCARWIEHVMDFGGDHLRPYSLEMPWYQFWMVDVLLVGGTGTALVICIFVCLVRYMYRTCCRKYRKEKMY